MRPSHSIEVGHRNLMNFRKNNEMFTRMRRSYCEPSRTGRSSSIDSEGSTDSIFRKTKRQSTDSIDYYDRKVKLP